MAAIHYFVALASSSERSLLSLSKRALWYADIENALYRYAATTTVAQAATGYVLNRPLAEGNPTAPAISLYKFCSQLIVGPTSLD